MLDQESIPSVGEQAYRLIRNDIIFGRLAPGARLRLEKLRDRYKVSITTLREILARLAADGFVRAEGQKGFAVAPVSDEDLTDIAKLRILLESHALEQSFADGDVDWEASVVAAHHKLNVMERKMISGDLSVRETWKRYDWEFHRALIQACGLRLLLATHGEVFDKYLRYQMLTLTFRGEEAARDHRDLMQAALSRDAEAGKAILRRHILSGVEHSVQARMAERRSA
ncbi:GntR family transcriptional regulator [Nitratireductor thuwali]|uniref:HTH-type transcriptional repressor RspR n=1 Tax=Nitratireductor thuwali TaxID=2267699 RepID=A0ABY5MGS6_9HYPH|nr:HTH-type transcriptional repressor RspR [Nitratireductor thuwali]